MSEITLARDSNQALGLGRYAVAFLSGSLGEPADAVLDRTALYFTDSVVCGLSALALRTNAPMVLRAEALASACDDGVPPLASNVRVAPEKAILATCAAVREWDANGTNFGCDPARGNTAGEFGHNDFYAVPVAAAGLTGGDGAMALRGMVCLDEIRGRLAEVFALKDHAIDHVVHGAIASAAVYGAMLGATPAQIESAIGLFTAHHVPWRAIRAGYQLSDSKGASAAISTEAAIVGMQRAIRGFVGPADVFRNPEALWRRFQPTTGDSPFDLSLATGGDDFAVMGMHFKLGLYEHQSAGALQALLALLQAHPALLSGPAAIQSIRILAYEPALGIIGDPAKRDPRTRQSADHSMVYIVATALRKAQSLAAYAGPDALGTGDEGWTGIMLGPDDYLQAALHDETTRSLMAKIAFEHGGPDYDAGYPDGIPTSMIITDADGREHDSGLVLHPAGHARSTTADLWGLLSAKFRMLGEGAMADPQPIIDRCRAVGSLGADDLRTLWNIELTWSDDPYD